MVETKYIAGLFALSVGVGLLLRQISFFPYPEMLTETYFLSKGMLPYVQINDQHFPGLFLLPINLRTLGFDNVERLRWLHLGLIGFTTLILYKLIDKLRWIILFFVFFLLWEGNTLWVDSFVAPLVLLAFYGLWSKWSFLSIRNLFLTGVLLGTVLVFKQHAVIICGVAALWVLSQRVSWKYWLGFVIGGILPMSFVGIYYYQLGVWPDFWFWTVTHNLTGYISLEGRMPGIGELTRFLLLVIPAIFGLQKFGKLLWPAGLFILASLIYLVPRFGLIHAQVALPLLIFLLSRKPKLYWPILGLSLLLMTRIFAKEIPGKILFYDKPSIITANYVEMNVDRTKSIYVYGVNDNIYHLTNTLPPNKTWVELLRGNIIPGVEEQLIKTLKIDPPQFVLVDRQATIDNMSISEFTPEIWRYLQINFFPKEKLSNGVEVWYPI